MVPPRPRALRRESRWLPVGLAAAAVCGWILLNWSVAIGDTAVTVGSSSMSSLSFSVLTLNVWFGRHEFERRMAGIVDLLVANKADFVCLQEVTPRGAQIFKSDARLKELYDVNKHSVGRYGVLLLAKKRWKAKFKETGFPSDMGRVLLSAIVNLDDGEGAEPQQMIVSTAHFESLSSHSLREEQMEVANRVQKDYTNAVLCGDFNFCSYRNFDLEKKVLENDSLKQKLPEHEDLWPLLHDTTKEEEKGYTFDSTINTNIHKFERMRYDRILSKLKDAKPRSIQIIGNKSLEGGGVSVFPSDHFGLLAHFA